MLEFRIYLMISISLLDKIVIQIRDIDAHRKKILIHKKVLKPVDPKAICLISKFSLEPPGVNPISLHVGRIVNSFLPGLGLDLMPTTS